MSSGVHPDTRGSTGRWKLGGVLVGRNAPSPDPKLYGLFSDPPSVGQRRRYPAAVVGAQTRIKRSLVNSHKRWSRRTGREPVQVALAVTSLYPKIEVVPAVDQTFPLERAAEAMRRLAAGQFRGKLVITAGGKSRP